MSSRPEKIINVDINLIIDPTLLRALKLIESEDDILCYSINGETLIPLKVKFKQPAKFTPEYREEEVVLIHHDGKQLDNRRLPEKS